MTTKSDDLNPRILEKTLIHVYFLCLPHPAIHLGHHYCSLPNPCRVAIQTIAPLLNLRLVCSAWDHAVQRLRNSTGRMYFNRVEDAYYPHAWHINTRVRRAALLGQYRVYRTIDSDSGDRGVYLAYDFGGRDGCTQANQVVVKCWTSELDAECISEQRSYAALCSGNTPMIGLPTLMASKYDAVCGVYAIVMQKLGPSLEDLRELLPARRFNEKMVLGVAIQMLDRYRDIHARGVIHNGVKPANILFSAQDPAGANPTTPSDPTLFAIDFGLSFPLDLTTKQPLPRSADSVGNRRFLSVLAHLGISQSQRDDLESLAYLLSYLYHGSLPWDPLPYGLSSPLKAGSQTRPHIWRIKASTSASVLFAGMDDVFVEFWKDLKSLAFGETPDYERLKTRFKGCWKRREFGGREGEVDWWGIWRARTDINPFGDQTKIDVQSERHAVQLTDPAPMKAPSLSIFSPVSTFRGVVATGMVISSEPGTCAHDRRLSSTFDLPAARIEAKLSVSSTTMTVVM